MIPTLRPLDLVEVSPYGGRLVQVGDVVAFLPRGKTVQVVHRVVGLSPEGVRTRGDNNVSEDHGFLRATDLNGHVIAAWRGQKRLKIYGGSVGHLIANAVRIIRKPDRFISWILRPAYDALAGSGALRQILPPGWRPRLVSYLVDGSIHYQLLLSGHLVGRYDHVFGVWRIKRPFKLLVDERSLPVPGREPTDAGQMATVLQRLPAER